MTKQTKRQRKFIASGGVQGRIEKGGSFGKRKRHKKAVKNDKAKASNHNPPNAATVERPDDFLSTDNIADLDVDSFFASFAPGGAAELKQEETSGTNMDVSDDEVSINEDDEQGDGDEKDDEHQEGGIGETTRKDMKQKPDDTDESSDDDEDPDIAEARMRAEMAKLEQSDPAFHQYLQENESSLLSFRGVGDTAAGIAGTDGNEEEEEDEPMEDTATEPNQNKREGSKSTGGIKLNPSLLAKLCTSAFDYHGIKALRKIVAAYRCACYLSEDKTLNNPDQNFVIESSKVFNDLMIMCLNKCHGEFRRHLEVDHDSNSDDKDASPINKPLNPKTLQKADQWDNVRPILLSFLRSTQHILTEAKDAQLLAFVLKALVNYAPLMTPFSQVAEASLKTLTQLWSAPLDSSEDYQIVRLQAFLRIRQLALTQPFPFLEECLKKTYLAYAKRSKFGGSLSNTDALSTLTLMGNCVVELYSLDFQSSYQHAFIYIRQLALLLRGAFQKKTVESFQQVYCLQYIQCLRLWTAVLAAAAPADDGELMKSLVYPLVEVIMATARSCPNPVRHAPLRFHCVRLVQQLAATAQIFIPTTPLLLDCMDWKEWTLNPKKSKKELTSGVDISSIVKFGQEDPLRSFEELEACIMELLLLVNREIDLYRYSAGFPEFSIRIVGRLRQFAKALKNKRWTAYTRACIETAEKHAKFAIAERTKLKQAPKDIKVLECLKPPEEKNMYERYEANVAKERKAIAGTTGQPRTTDTTDSTAKETQKGSKVAQKKKRKTSKNVVLSDEGSSKTLDENELKQVRDNVQEGVEWTDDEDE